MKLQQFLTTDINSVFLYLFILFADLDYASLADYTIKALIGGAVWFLFKVVGDYFARRVKRYHKSKSSPEADNRSPYDKEMKP